MKGKNKKVLVAMSGGVDSSLSAHLLKEQDYDVSGVFFSFLNNKAAEEKAERAAKDVGIPLHILNIEEDFKKEVIDYFKKELLSGKTPNPCVVCNRKIKFKKIIEKADELGVDFVATGHYVQIKEGKLMKGEDEKKDQSYFLWNIKKEWLGRVLFPVGGLTKKEVRALAKKHNLSSAEEKESQEICFIEDDLSSFLKYNIKDNPGDIVTSKGDVIGRHKGLFYHTIGQRKGLNLPNGPFYVLNKDLKNNTLIITKNEEELERKEFYYQKSNFFKEVEFPFKAEVKVRYRSKPLRAIVEEDRVILENSERAITEGQSVVFYNKEELLGGGLIVNK